MPRVMTIQGVPVAGAYKPPVGRVLNGVGYVPSNRVPTLRRDLRRPIPVLGWLPSGRIPAIRQDLRSPSALDIRHRAVRGALGGLGDLCTDDGWQAVNTLMTGVGSGFTTGSRTTVDGEVQTDAGFAAIGSGLTSAASSWRDICAAQNQQGSDPTAADSAMQMYNLEMLRRQYSGDAYNAAAANAAAAAAAAERERLQQQQQDKTLQYVGYAAVGVAVLGALYFVVKK